jgi:proteasome lid subunit RPN8/RPN11
MIFVPRELAEKMRDTVRGTYPNEGCGLIIGLEEETDRVVEVRAMENSYASSGPAETRRNRYTIDPLDLLAAERALDGSGRVIAGVFHSHPDHPARPSEYDRGHAWPAWHYIVISVVAGEPKEMRSWLLREDRSDFDEESLEIA